MRVITSFRPSGKYLVNDYFPISYGYPGVLYMGHDQGVTSELGGFG